VRGMAGEATLCIDMAMAPLVLGIGKADANK
jgi:hypothetical protein